MFIAEKRYTVDEFLQFVEQSETDTKWYELIEGIIYEMSPSKSEQTVIGGNIFGFLFIHMLQHDNGFLAPADGGFRLSDRDFFAPDVAFYSREKLPNGLPKGNYFTVAPDFAAEVVSTHDNRGEVHQKALRYIELGTRLVWVVYPKPRTVHVYTPLEGGAAVRVFKHNETLDGGNVLPGFTLSLKDIFRSIE